MLAPYYHRGGSALVHQDLAAPGRAYREAAWYRETASSRLARWSEPRVAPGEDGLRVVTLSLPAVTADGDVRAVVGVDVSLEWLRGDLEPRLDHLREDVPRDEPLPIEVIVLSASGRFVSSPDLQRLLDRRVQEFVDDADDVGPLVERMLAGEAGFEEVVGVRDGGRRWVHYAPVPGPGWSVAVVFNESKVLAGVAAKQRDDLLYAAAGIALLVAVVAGLARRITRNLRRLSAHAARIGSGDLDTPVDVAGSRDEVDVLAGVLRRMQGDLKAHVARLAEETEARARIETELEAARNIQLAMLPRAEPERAGATYDCAASLISAREVGGDLYDVLELDDGRLAFVVGDVSGKGVPAALFMARTLTLFELACRAEPAPGAVLEKLNVELERDNEACMFVTMFCGVLEPSTGRLRTANAGHNPPVLVGRRGARLLETPGGTVLGVLDTARYPETELVLAPDDALIVYTDGVTEALDGGHALYGEERLLESVALARRDARSLVDSTLGGVEAYSAGAEQSDDITVLAVRAAPAGSTWDALPGEVLSLASDRPALETARAWLERICRAAGVRDDLVGDAQLVCEEVLANVVDHAYRGDPSREMSVRAIATGAAVRLAFRDSGPAYNPLDAAPPDLAQTPEERAVGGLGVHLVRRLAARVDYAREDGHNVLSVLCDGRGAS